MTLIFVCHPWRGKKTHDEMTKKICWHIATVDKLVPFSPAIHFNQFLSDDIYEQREAGINGGLKILIKCDVMYVYTMHGVSEGMGREIDFAERNQIKIIRFEKYPWESE